MVFTNNKWIKGWQISVGVGSLLLGFLLSVQFKSQSDLRASSANIPSRRVEELTNLLKESEEKRSSLERTLLALKEEITGVRNNSGTEPTENEEAADLGNQIITGSTALSGTGVLITIDDSNNIPEQGENHMNAVLQNEDLLKITNELYASGAEAISINGNRLVSNSEISAAGQIIVINKNRVYPPFKIRAIGDPETMTTSLEMKGGIVEYLKFFGIEVKIEKNQEINIPAYVEGMDFKYAKPAPEVLKQ